MQAKVLLIDGEGGWAASAAEVLARLRPTLDVVCCHSAAQALRLAEQQVVALAMADLVLSRPGMGGASTLARLRELYPSCRTVLVTDHEALRPLLQGCADALVAPGGDGRKLAETALEVVGAILETASLGQSDGKKGASREAGAAEANQQAIADGRSVQVASGARPGATGTPLFGDRPVPMQERLFGGKYRPLKEIGQGGMALVLQAEDTFIHRLVALKVMQVPPRTDPEEMRRRMRREVTIAGRLTHPHVVTVYDAGVDGQAMYLVMELIEGPTLLEMLRQRGALPPSEAVAVCLQILDALALAHARGFVHRDLKPSNVLLTRDGVVKVADFGLAKLMVQGEETLPTPLNHDLTGDERIVGTPQYMAPEQLRGDAVDARSDLYAVGLILFEMLHGASLAHFVKPLVRAAALMDPRRDQPLPRYEQEPQLQAVLDRALALKPSDRFVDASDFAKALAGAGNSSWPRYLRWPFARWGQEPT